MVLPFSIVLTRVGAVAFHCARRMRVLARDILRFGTAISNSSLLRRWPGHRLRRWKHRPTGRGRRAQPIVDRRELHARGPGYQEAAPHTLGTGRGNLPDRPAGTAVKAPPHP